MAQTDTAAVSWDQVAYDQYAYLPLRAELYFDMLATIKPTNQSMAGSSVVFDKKGELAAAITPLTEGVDVTPVGLTDTPVSVALQEYGNATESTAKLRGTSYIEVDSAAAESIGYNAGLSIDTVTRNIVQAGTNVFYGGAVASRVTVAAGTIITAAKVRFARAKLAGGNVRGWYSQAGGLYGAMIHPDVNYDLRQETGAGAWRVPREYIDATDVFTGEVGLFEGFRFIESPRAPLFVDTGVGGTVDVYGTLFFGEGFLAKTWSKSESSEQPEIRVGLVVDRLKRFHSIGWYFFGGYGIFRQEAIWRLETSSSIGTN